MQWYGNRLLIVAFYLIILPNSTLFAQSDNVLVWEGVSSGQDYSGAFLNSALSNAGFSVTYTTSFPAALNNYDAVFLSFGNSGADGSHKTTFSSSNAAKVQAYLEAGGKVYLEGGDALGADQAGNTNLLALFGLTAAEDGATNPLDNLSGQTGSLSEGISFSGSSQDNQDFIDKYTPGGGVSALLESGYGTVAVQHSAVNGLRTFCFSYAIANLSDGSFPSTRNNLLTEIINFFELGDISPNLSVQPGAIDVTLSSGQQYTTTITIANNGSGTLNWDIQGETANVLLNNGSLENSVLENTATKTLSSTTGGKFASEKPPFLNIPDSKIEAIPLAKNANTSSSGISLVVDDGGRENAIGLEDGGQFIWLNRFTPSGGEFPFTLNEIWILFGSGLGVSAGDDIDIYIYEDTDGDADPGTGAVLVGSHLNADVQAADDAAFSVYFISPIVLNGPGDVIIAVVNRTAGVAAGEFPAAMDQSGSAGRSWIGSYSSGNPGSSPALPATDIWGNTSSFGFAGNWMIRGRGYQNGDCSWLSETPFSGQILAGGSQDITITIDAGQLPIGDYNCTLVIDSNDPDQPQLSIPVSMSITNLPPSLSAIADQSLDEAETLEIDISASDPEGDAISLSAENLPAFASFSDAGDGSGTITFTPDFEDGGIYSAIQIIATDDGVPAKSDTATFDLTVAEVNRMPDISAISNQEMEETETLVIILSASDPDDNDLSFSVNNLPQFGVLNDNGDGSGTITLMPGFDDADDYENITITARDDGSPELTANTTFTLTVNNRNRAPQLSAIADQAVAEAETLTVEIAADDPDGDELSFSSSLPAFAEFSDDGNGDGAITFRPDFEDEGEYQIEIIVIDDSSPQLSDTTAFQMMVSGTNRSPEIAAISDQVMNEGDSLQIDIEASDPEGDQLSLTVGQLPDFGEFTDNGDGTARIRLLPGFSDADDYPDIEVRVMDNGEPALTTIESFDLTVENINRPPRAVNDVVEIDEDMAVVIDVLRNDTDPDEDPLHIIDILDNNTEGTATIGEGDTTLAFQPALNRFEDDQVTYIISDNNGGLDTAVVNILIEPVNDAPSLNFSDSLIFFADISGAMNIWNNVEDPESEVSELTFSFAVVPDTFDLNYDAGSGTLIISARTTEIQSQADLIITASDPQGASAVDTIGLRAISTAVGIENPLPAGIPDTYIVEQNFPNPFNPSTEIRFGLPSAAAVELEILNILGQRVGLLVNGRLSAGYHSITFDASHLTSGIYFYHLQAEGRGAAGGQQFRMVKKMMLLK